MSNLPSKAYYWFLWVSGAALTDEELEELKGGGDRITFWFRRSKKRLGYLWWVAVGCFILLHTAVLYDNIKHKRWVKVGIGIAGYAFLGWLLPHIIGTW